MRKVKGWIAYMVVCVLVLTCAPIPASAASGSDELGGVSITLNNKVEGVNAQDYEKYLNVNLGNFQLFNKMGGDGYYVEDDANPGLGDMTGVFEAGKNYSVSLYLIPQERYVMAEGTVINYTCNGTAGTVSAQKTTIDSVDYIYIKICCSLSVEESALVDAVSMSIRTDLDGVSTADYNSYATLSAESLKCCFDGIYVTDTGYNAMDVFEAGKTYDLWISLKAKAGYKLPALGETISCKINGKDVTATVTSKIQTTKLTSSKVGSKAFKGTYSKAKVTVPKKSLKAYKKFLYKKGLNKKAKITK